MVAGKLLPPAFRWLSVIEELKWRWLFALDGYTTSFLIKEKCKMAIYRLLRVQESHSNFRIYNSATVSPYPGPLYSSARKNGWRRNCAKVPWRRIHTYNMFSAGRRCGSMGWRR